jgi:hypothetical protein
MGKMALPVILACFLASLLFAQESQLVVINEFGQGVAGSGEWVELLVIGTGPCSAVDLRGFRLLDREGYLGYSFPTRVVFKDVQPWAAVPAGTLIVIYKGDEPASNFPPNFPFNDLDFSDYRVSIPHTNTDFFENVAWGGFGNAGDYVVLVDRTGALVDGLSYGNRTGEGTAPAVKLAGVPANTAAWFTGGSTAFINDPTYWATGSESASQSTPGQPNTPANAAWIASLRPKPVISVSPLSLDFGPMNVGAETSPLPVTVANVGCADLSVGTLYLSGSDVDQFRIQNDGCSGQAIAPGGSRRVEVVFRPTSVGTKSATLVIPSNDPDQPEVQISLTGTGTVTALSVDAGGPYTGRVGVPITLRASASGGLSPYTFAWDLDADGEFDDAEGAEITYTWYTPGLYTVQVQVRDSLGNAATDTAEVRVLPAKGDVNGDGAIDLVDLRLAYQAALGLISLAPEQAERADLDDDGDVDMVDVELLCGLILGGCG